MMIRVYLVILICVGPYLASGQQLPAWSTFYENGFIWNPALTAKWNSWEASATHRREWQGFEDAPEHVTMSFQMPFLRKFTKASFGTYIEYDKVGPFTSVNLAGTYTYRIRSRLFGNRDDVLSMGFMGKFGQVRFEPKSLVAFDGLEGEISLKEQSSSVITPNVSIGLFYISVSDFYSFKSHYYAGVSLNNLVPTTLIDVPLGDIRSGLHATVHAGYRHFPRRAKHYIEPNMMIIYGFAKAINVMANVRYEATNRFWMSAGLVSHGEVFGQFGLIFNDRSALKKLVKDGTLRIGIKMDYNVGNYRRLTGFGSEIYLAYLFEME